MSVYNLKNKKKRLSMPPINRFHELDAWQQARILTREIYSLTRRTSLKKDFGLRDQIQRATVSVMSNIAEGFGYKSDKQFIHFLSISRASACEVQSLLIVALDADLIDLTQFDRTNKYADKTLISIAGLQRYLRNLTSK